MSKKYGLVYPKDREPFIGRVYDDDWYGVRVYVKPHVNFKWFIGRGLLLIGLGLAVLCMVMAFTKIPDIHKQLNEYKQLEYFAQMEKFGFYKTDVYVLNNFEAIRHLGSIEPLYWILGTIVPFICLGVALILYFGLDLGAENLIEEKQICSEPLGEKK